MSLGTLLRSRRVALGLNQADMARKLSYALETVEKIENDEMVPPETKIVRIGRAYSINPDSIMKIIQGGEATEEEMKPAPKKKPGRKPKEEKSEIQTQEEKPVEPVKLISAMNGYPPYDPMSEKHDDGPINIIIKGPIRARVKLALKREMRNLLFTDELDECTELLHIIKLL